MKRVKDYMRKDVVTFGPHDSIFDVAEILAKEGISGAPVVDGRKLVGIITVSDVIKFMEVNITNTSLGGLEKQSTTLMVTLMIKDEIEYLAKVKKMSKSLVKDFMTKDVVSIGPDSPIIEAAELLDKHKVNRLPVVDEKGKLIGVLSRTDMLRALLDKS